MNLLLLDVGVLLASEDVDDTQHEAAVRLLTGADRLATLDLAYYEVANVAVRAWRHPVAGDRLRQRLDALADDGGIVRADSALLADAQALAVEHGLSVYDAAYVAAARRIDARLVSCDVRDLVSREFAVLPAAVVSGT